MDDYVDTLGEMIEALEKQPQGNWIYVDGPVLLVPEGLYSWRGAYEDLAFGCSPVADEGTRTVSEFLDELRSAVGQSFAGWKGGGVTMGLKSKLWISNEGESSSIKVAGISSNLCSTRISWREIDY